MLCDGADRSVADCSFLCGQKGTKKPLRGPRPLRTPNLGFICARGTVCPDEIAAVRLSGEASPFRCPSAGLCQNKGVVRCSLGARDGDSTNTGGGLHARPLSYITPVPADPPGPGSLPLVALPDETLSQMHTAHRPEPGRFADTLECSPVCRVRTRLETVLQIRHSWRHLYKIFNVPCSKIIFQLVGTVKRFL